MANTLFSLQQELQQHQNSCQQSLGKYARANIFLTGCGGDSSDSSKNKQTAVIRTGDEVVFATDVLNFFFKPPNYSPIPESAVRQNSNYRALAACMIHDAKKSSRAMDLVPRPTIKPSLGWLANQAFRAAVRSAFSNGIYETVRTVVAAAYTNDLTMIKNGLQPVKCNGNMASQQSYFTQYGTVAGSSSPAPVQGRERDQLAVDILKLFYNASLLPSPLTPELHQLAARLIWTAISSSQRSQRVPRFEGAKPAQQWLQRPEVHTAIRQLLVEGFPPDLIVRIKNNFQSEFDALLHPQLPTPKPVPMVAGQQSNSAYSLAQMHTAIQFSSIPLDPGTGGQSIMPDALQSGDIILSTTNAPVSAAIRVASGSPVSHARVYIGNGQIVEAVSSGVEMKQLSDVIADDSVTVAFRHPQITERKAQVIRDFVGQQLGRPYGYGKIARFAIGNRAFRTNSRRCNLLPSQDMRQRCINWVGRVFLGTPDNDSFFCSELVIAAYNHVGLPLTTTAPNWNTPGDIANMQLRGQLEYVGHLKT